MEMVHKIRRKSDGLFYSEKGWTNMGKKFTSTDQLLNFLILKKDNQKGNVLTIRGTSDLEIVSFTLDLHAVNEINEWEEYNNAYAKVNKTRMAKLGGFLFEVIFSGKYVKDGTTTVFQKDKDGFIKIEDLFNSIQSLNTEQIREATFNYTRQYRGYPRKAFRFNHDLSAVQINTVSNGANGMEIVEVEMAINETEQEKQEA